jgi:hypothetical protein
MADEIVDTEAVVETTNDTPAEGAAPKSAAVTKPVPPAIKAAQDAAKAKAAVVEPKKSILEKAGDPEAEKPEATPEVKEVPEKYELELPEGAEINSELMGELEPLLKGEKVSLEGANKLAALHLKGIEQAVANIETQAIAQDEAWEKELMTELGAKAPEELSFAAKARDTFFSKETRDFFDKHHIGSNPHFIKDLVKVGKRISESAIIEGGSQKGEGFDAKKMYPSMPNA